MKQIYPSVLVVLFLCAWTSSQATDCEKRYQQLRAQHLAERQAALLKYEQVYAKTTKWFKEAKRNSPSVKTMYRMRSKNDEAIAALDKAYAEKLTLLDSRQKAELAHLEAECNQPKLPKEKITVDVLVTPGKGEKASRKAPVISKNRVEEDATEAEIAPRKPSKRKKRRAARLKHEATMNSLIADAEKHLGTRYKYGGNRPGQGFDCSGYVSYVYQKYGVDLPRVSREQAKQGSKVKRKDAAPGDLVYFGPRKGKITHVGIVTSKPGKPLTMIHASSSKGVEHAYIDGVKYWEKRVQGFRRLIEP